MTITQSTATRTCSNCGSTTDHDVMTVADAPVPTGTRSIGGNVMFPTLATCSACGWVHESA